MPRWRNGRRGGLKIRFSVREWGFESLPGHHFFLPYPVAIFLDVPIARAIIVGFDTSLLAATENRYSQITN